jgi:hypothetical protein
LTLNGGGGGVWHTSRNEVLWRWLKYKNFGWYFHAAAQQPGGQYRNIIQRSQRFFRNGGALLHVDLIIREGQGYASQEASNKEIQQVCCEGN